jgi:hypothetical protein
MDEQNVVSRRLQRNQRNLQFRRALIVILCIPLGAAQNVASVKGTDEYIACEANIAACTNLYVLPINLLVPSQPI